MIEGVEGGNNSWNCEKNWKMKENWNFTQKQLESEGILMRWWNKLHQQLNYDVYDHIQWTIIMMVVNVECDYCIWKLIKIENWKNSMLPN